MLGITSLILNVQIFVSCLWGQVHSTENRMQSPPEINQLFYSATDKIRYGECHPLYHGATHDQTEPPTLTFQEYILHTATHGHASCRMAASHTAASSRILHHETNCTEVYSGSYISTLSNDRQNCCLEVPHAGAQLVLGVASPG